MLALFITFLSSFMVFPQMCSDFLFCLSVLLRIFVYGYKLADQYYGGEGDTTPIVLEKLFW